MNLFRWIRKVIDPGPVVIHKPTGYRGWLDQKPTPRPNTKALLGIAGSLFGCGAFCILSLGGTWFAFNNWNSTPIPPTLVVIQIPTQTPTERYNVLVNSQPDATSTPTFTPTHTPEATIPPEPTADLAATVEFLLAQPSPLPKDVTVNRPEPVFCDGAPFIRYGEGSVAFVRFENKSALRLLDHPRVPNSIEPKVQKLLYDGYQIEITGEPVCGQWLGNPVVYYPVFVQRFSIGGWVGFGMRERIWLEAAGR